jgi:hypothetical protein
MRATYGSGTVESNKHNKYLTYLNSIRIVGDRCTGAEALALAGVAEAGSSDLPARPPLAAVPPV